MRVILNGSVSLIKRQKKYFLEDVSSFSDYAKNGVIKLHHCE
ncbi:hypothetical protein [Helicobacter sp. 12S02232-10]|nr:hypothetical protein [Helicobacter sp. 12S02232-10]